MPSRSRSRSRSPRKEKSKSKSKSRSRSRSVSQDRSMYKEREEEGVEIMEIDTAAAAFVLGRGGSTKRKIERVSECRLDLDERRGTIEMRGTNTQRRNARDYQG
jgi:polyribonucleotide nucleotidyltransferase